MKDRISISISILAIIISGVSLYFSNFQRPDFDFNCGVEIEVYKSMEGSTDKDLLVPFSFVNKSNQAGSIMQIKLNICPFINKKQLGDTLCNRDFL